MLIPLAGAGVSLGAIGLGATSLLGSGTRFMQRLTRHAPARAIVDTVAQPHPAIGRRCLRSDLEQRDIVIRLAARKARLVGPAGYRATGPIPVKRSRRFEFRPG